MRLPTLRQLNGFVMIVNTLLPALVILLLGAMLWSTAVSFKRNTCAVIIHVAQATNDKAALDAYLDARSREDEKAQDAAVSRLVITSYSIHYTKLYDIHEFYEVSG